MTIREADALWAAWDRAYTLGMRFALAVGVCLVLYAAIFCQIGCSHPPADRAKPADTKPVAEAIRDNVKAGLNANESTGKAIDAAAVKAPEVKPELDTAKSANHEQNKAFFAIDAERVKLADVQAKFDAQAKELNAAIAAKEKAESEAGKREHMLLVMLRIGAGLAVAVSIALMIWGTLRTALPTILAAAVFVATIVMQVALDHLILIGLGCGGAAVLAIVYELWIKHKSIREIAATVDNTVRDASDQLPAEFVKVAGLVQSKITRKLIDGTQGNGPVNKMRRWLGGFIAGQPVPVKV